MITIADWIITIVVFICLMILQREIYKQDVEEAYEEGYRKGLYTVVIKASEQSE